MFREAPVTEVHAEEIDVDRRKGVDVVAAAARGAVEFVRVECPRQAAREPIPHRGAGNLQPARDLGSRQPVRRQLEASVDDADGMSHSEHMFAYVADGMRLRGFEPPRPFRSTGT